MRRALRHGEVPPDVDVATWIATVDMQHRQLRRNRRMAQLVFAPLVLLSIWLAATDGAYWWFGVALFAALLASSLIITPRELRRTDKLRDELGRRQKGGASVLLPEQRPRQGNV